MDRTREIKATIKGLNVGDLVLYKSIPSFGVGVIVEINPSMGWSQYRIFFTGRADRAPIKTFWTTGTNLRVINSA